MELRIDALRHPDPEKVGAMLSGFKGQSILTVRRTSEGGGFRGSEAQRVSLLRSLSTLEPTGFDVELQTLEANPGLAGRLKAETIIVSWHDHTRTPGRARLRAILERERVFGVPKLVTMANSPRDNLEVLSLYEESGPPPIAFCMGERGTFSRVMSMELGTRMTYASLPGEPTAPGQLTLPQALAIRSLLGDA